VETAGSRLARIPRESERRGSRKAITQQPQIESSSLSTEL